MRAMIFAAGLGTRLKPLTDTMPKAMVPLAGKPLIQWQIESLYRAGIREIVVNVHHFPDQIIDFVKRFLSMQKENLQVKIEISDERSCLLETGGGLRKAVFDLGWQNEPILVCNVDVLSNLDIPHLISTYESTRRSQLVVSERTTQRYLCFSPITTDKNAQRLCGWTNIQTGELKLHDGKHLAFSGTQILTPDVLARLGEMKEEKFSLIDFYLHICPESLLHAYIPQDYRMMDVGKINQIEEAESFARSL